MASTLYITTSQGVFHYSEGMKHPEVCLKRERRIPFFRKGGFGFFGIDCWRDKILVASRENFSKHQFAKHSEDVQVYSIDPKAMTSESIAKISGIADVHQIAVFQDLLYLTDTGHNRVSVFDLSKNEITSHINVGREREDVNHINAVTVEDGQLYIGLNNRGKTDSQVLSIPLAKLPENTREIDADSLAETIQLEGLTHTHDFEKFSDDWYVCASHQGVVFKAQPTIQVCAPGKWVRGLAGDENGLWVGMSEKLDRKNRHREDVDGEISLWSQDLSQELKRVSLSCAGQVNDLLLL